MPSKDFSDFKQYLNKYRQKRDFAKTPEPKGALNAKAGRKTRFVVHEHWASHHHFDLRLEINGTLKSWAVPKQIPDKPGDKFLALRVEDHPLEYINFQGIIPQGEYGAGKVKIWDTGEYSIREKYPKKLLLDFDGEKMKGHYSLVKFKEPDNWLIIKEKIQEKEQHEPRTSFGNLKRKPKKYKPRKTFSGR